MRVVLTFLLSALVAQTVYAQAMYNQSRCTNWGSDNLTIPEAQERHAWAEKCDPRVALMRQIEPDYLPAFQMINGAKRWVYPIFGVVKNGVASNPNNYFAPRNRNAGCNLPSGYKIVGVCLGGCFTPEQIILFSDGAYPIAEAKEKQIAKVMGLSADSTVGTLSFEERKVRGFHASIKKGDHLILKIKTKSGGELRVTEEHPLVDGEGRMQAAGTLVAGDTLMTEFGEADEIASIEKEDFFGKVYNVDVDSDELEGKVIVAQGFLSGDVSFQNENTKFLNQLVVRMSYIPDSVVE